ncbi:phospholipase D family protein [Klebsiella pneumoniae]|uniref:phospholipase D family nuclease n=1 Tax=Klebsiella pneumoniae TaxID=573 RepID=UPI00397601B2
MAGSHASSVSARIPSLTSCNDTELTLRVSFRPQPEPTPIRLMGYSFTSPEVAGALVRAKQRDVDVKVVLDGKENTGKQHQASQAAMNLLANAGIPVRTVSQFKIMHDKVIIADGRDVEVGSFNYTRAADRSNSENVIVIRGDRAIAQRYLQHWESRWQMGTDWKPTY